MFLRLRARLNRLNPIAHTQDVVRGDIDPDWLFNIAAPGAPRVRDFSDLVEQVDAHAGHHHDHATAITMTPVRMVTFAHFL